MLVDGIRAVRPGVAIKTVDDGRAAVEFLEKCDAANLPSLIVLDYKMPFLNAADVLLIITEQSQLAGIPKLVWSTSMQPKDAAACVGRGATDYIQKPASQAELRIIVERVIRLGNF